ncbi:MAG: DUF2804 domain-containing protein, partial [Treponema sp.]|nr:DUF2804 domain-containing protein [Treponema sp.]
MPQNEVHSALSVVDETGRPQNFGWSRQPGFFYDPVMVWAPRRKISESDRYIVFSPTHAVIFEICDDGFLGHMGVTVVSRREKKRSTHSFQTLLPLGTYGMPPQSRTGAVRYRRNGALLDLVPMEGGARIIRTDIPKQGNVRGVRGELVLSEPMPIGLPAESLACNLPWRTDENAFRYSRCSPWYTVEGVVQFGTTEIVFTKGNSWGIFDWNRGVRPRADTRYWATACGMASGRLLGLSVGHGSEDTSEGTGNAFFVDGLLHKLDQITFQITPADWLSPWRFTSNDNRLEMTFTPRQERADRRRFLHHSFSRRQFYGNFSGRAILDDGSDIAFNNITGFAER